MNLIYPSHAKNQVRFGEKSEKKRFGAPWRDGTGGAFPENEARAGASRREMAAVTRSGANACGARASVPGNEARAGGIGAECLLQAGCGVP